MPIRTAIVGLSASAKTSWASTAHLPNFLTPAGREKFAITALLNSSVAAAEAAIVAYNLDPAKVRAYGSAEDLANDDNVDLVVVNTRVDKHAESALVAIKKGKSCYIEWPIAANLGDTEELAALAKEKGVAVAVGLQGRWAAPILRVKQLLQGGEYGKLLSSNVQAYGGTKDRAVLPEGLKYFSEKAVGGNPITIGFSHVIDYVQSVVGELDESTTSVRMQIQRPKVPIRDPNTLEVLEVVESDVPDLVTLHGHLTSQYAVENATFSMYYRRGQPFPGQPSLVWTLNCEKGEIRLVAPAGISLQADAYAEPVKIHVHEFAADRVVDIAWTWDETQMTVPVRARSVLKCLYALADGDESGYVSLEDAAARTRQIDSWISKAVV